MSTSVETFTDSDRLVAAVGERLIEVVDSAVAARGRALVVLTGGGNGNRLMRFLAALSRAISAAQAELRAHRAAAELANLDDRMLRDIGISRSEIPSGRQGRSAAPTRGSCASPSLRGCQKRSRPTRR